MKKILICAALLIGAPALAQTETPPAETMPPVETMPPAETAPMPSETTAPAPPSAAPAPVTVAPSPSVAEAFPPPAPKTDYPWCSRTVTDSCKQRNDPGYAKSRRRG